MLTNVKAQEYIEKLIKEQEERLDKNSDDEMRELIKIGFANIHPDLDLGHFCL